MFYTSPTRPAPGDRSAIRRATLIKLEPDPGPAPATPSFLFVSAAPTQSCGLLVAGLIGPTRGASRARALDRAISRPWTSRSASSPAPPSRPLGLGRFIDPSPGGSRFAWLRRVPARPFGLVRPGRMGRRKGTDGDGRREGPGAGKGRPGRSRPISAPHKPKFKF